MFPAFWEAFVKVKGVRVPPEASVHGSTATENASSHDGVVSTGNTLRVDPDLVVETRDVEASEPKLAQSTTSHFPHATLQSEKPSHTCFPYQKTRPPRRSYCELLSKLRMPAKPIRSNIVNRRKRIKVTIRIPHILHRTADS